MFVVEVVDELAMVDDDEYVAQSTWVKVVAYVTGS